MNIDDPKDGMSQSGAAKLAKQIEAHWNAEGFPSIRVRLECETYRKKTLWFVRSNLLNGLPPDPRWVK